MLVQLQIIPYLSLFMSVLIYTPVSFYTDHYICQPSKKLPVEGYVFEYTRCKNYKLRTILKSTPPQVTVGPLFCGFGEF